MKRFVGQAVGWLICLASANLSAAFSAIEHSISHQQLFMQGQVALDLPQAIRHAIQQEIPIVFKTQIQLHQQREILLFNWSQRVQHIEYQTQLSYSQFYQTYTLHNLRNGNRLNFTQLDDALMVMGRFQDFPVSDLSQLHAGLDYRLQISIRLDWRALSAPLFSHALFNQAWLYNTGWITHPIKLGAT
ncbi:DUF4390 domain-containing protein [Thiomicrospira microaerophila]|uniref:DUF4390 domain-containing protein n=1 Tax=Thiomicrospira microaerophila TaxID=406020 RepID=UPI0005C83471|nr:DUF4390 domain-containing protein [Thiomicrospira microaerophila]